MKKWAVLIFICYLTTNFSQTNISPQFSELKGMEDQQGNTHLLYRIYTSGYGTMGYYYSNNIYRLEPAAGVDVFFLGHGGFADQFDEVNDLDFWDNNYSKYIYAGTHIYIEPFPEVYRYDQIDPIFSPQIWGVSNNIELSRQDTNLIIVSVDNGYNYRSIDWGNNWDSIAIGYEILSVSPFNDNIIFAKQGSSLLKSIDHGNTFFTVDTSKNYSINFVYDSDELHIYALDKRWSEKMFVVSNNKGEPFSWENKYSSDSEIFISNDESISGTIYLADKKNILISTDYGNNFSLYKTLDRKIIGLYKKSSSNKLYAATKYKIYEITPDTIQIIKSLPIPEEVLNYYPLAIGNHWVYGIYTNEGGNNIYWGDETRTIVDIPTTLPGSEVFLCIRKLINGELDSTYIKLDSLYGKLYASSSLYGDYLFYEDLLSEAGDTVCYEYNPAWNCQFVQPDTLFTEFGIISTVKKFFPQAPGWYFGHSLVKGIGLYEVYNGDLTTFQSILKGCIIDGIVYGDTTVVSVEDEQPAIVSEFKLEQNYPNPFNPSTKIKFTIPTPPVSSPLVKGRIKEGFVTLKVYDVLGNEIATLVNEELQAGEYEVEFSGHSGEGQNLPSGVYFYQLQVRGPETSSGQGLIQTKKMVLLK